MTPKEIEKLFNHPAELSAKTDGKGNEKVTLRGEVADLGWLVNKVVTGIYAQVDDPDTVRALDAAITMWLGGTESQTYSPVAGKRPSERT